MLQAVHRSRRHGMLKNSHRGSNLRRVRGPSSSVLIRHNRRNTAHSTNSRSSHATCRRGHRATHRSLEYGRPRHHRARAILPRPAAPPQSRRVKSQREGRRPQNPIRYRHPRHQVSLTAPPGPLPHRAPETRDDAAGAPAAGSQSPGAPAAPIRSPCSQSPRQNPRRHPAAQRMRPATVTRHAPGTSSGSFSRPPRDAAKLTGTTPGDATGASKATIGKKRRRRHRPDKHTRRMLQQQQQGQSRPPRPQPPADTRPAPSRKPQSVQSPEGADDSQRRARDAGGDSAPQGSHSGKSATAANGGPHRKDGDAET